MMDRPVVTSQASLIGRAFLKARLSHMACATLLPQQSVRSCKRPGVVRFWTPRPRMPAEPRQSRDREHARENPPPARNAVQCLEIIKIDALREFLGGADASSHLVP